MITTLLYTRATTFGTEWLFNKFNKFVKSQGKTNETHSLCSVYLVFFSLSYQGRLQSQYLVATAIAIAIAIANQS